MNRTLKLPLLVALTLGSTSAMALGLGQIHVKSALDQPLLADIPLTVDYPGQASHVSVALASAADFQRAGLDRSQIKAHLQFKVITNSKGQRVIRVTSTQPVHATYLDFLLKVSWPKGSMLREFTALLDPQGMAGSPAMNASAAGSGAASPRASSAPASAATSHQRSQQSAAAGPASSTRNNTYGPVRAGETLSAIARRELPRGVTINQMLLALYKANPDAFYRQNINALKRGAVLRIPSRDQATAESVAAAIAAVQRQDADWTASTAGSPTMVAHAGGQPGSGQASGGNESGDHLSLVAPKQGGSGHARPGVAGGSGNTSVSGLQQDLARTKESLSNTQQENADLQSRVSSLKSINDKNTKLLSLKSAQIAELQQKLAQARKAAGMPPVPAASIASAAAASPAAPGSAAMTAPASTASMANGNAALGAAATSSPATAAAATSAGAAPLASKPPVAKPSGRATARHHTPPPARPVVQNTPWFMRPWTWLVGAVVVIALLVLAWAGSRRKRAEVSGKPSLADQFGDSPFGPSSEVLDGDEPMDADQRDLLEQLAETPDDVGLHLELVSLYYARSDVEHFEGAAEAMYAHISDPEQPEWQDVVAMGRELTPEHPLFARESDQVATPVDAQVETATDEDLDLGGYVSEQDAEDIDEDVPEDIVPPSHADEAGESADTDGYSFDFDLTPRHASAADESDVPQPPTEEEYDALPPVAVDETDVREDVREDEGILPDADDTFGEHSDAEADDGPVAPMDETAPASDDPVDTKLDLARAYIDMGDPEGARAMLDEVIAEGTQMQKDMAGKLIGEMN